MYIQQSGFSSGLFLFFELHFNPVKSTHEINLQCSEFRFVFDLFILSLYRLVK